MRPAFRLAAWLAVSSMIAAPLLADDAARAFKPPPGKLILTRTVVRALPDGKQILIRRSYAITIRAAGEGFRAEGHIAAIKVEVPPKLEPIAAVERGRWIDDPFPITLGRDGQILSVTTSPAEAATRAQGAEASIKVLRNEQLDPAERRRREAFVTALARTGTGTLWPADLFNPPEDHTEAERALTLPDGRTGTVVTRTTVSGRFPGGVPRRFERLVTTQLDGHDSASTETWTVTEASGPN